MKSEPKTNIPPVAPAVPPRVVVNVGRKGRHATASRQKNQADMLTDAQGIVITWPRSGESVEHVAHKVDKRTPKDTPMQRKAVKKAAAEQLARRVSDDSLRKKSLIDESSNAGDVSEDSEVVSVLSPIEFMLFLQSLPVVVDAQSSIGAQNALDEDATRPVNNTPQFTTQIEAVESVNTVYTVTCDDVVQPPPGLCVDDESSSCDAADSPPPDWATVEGVDDVLLADADMELMHAATHEFAVVHKRFVRV
jgi:hypothetical protein